MSTASHDEVVRLIGSSSGMLLLQIAENAQSSDSSDSEFHMRTKSKFSGARRGNVHRVRVDEPVNPHVAEDAIRGTIGMRHDAQSYRHASKYFGEQNAPQNDYINPEGAENIDPHEQHYRRSRQVGHHYSHKAATRQRQTKHTIITREHRLGLTKSANIADDYGIRHLLPSMSASRPAPPERPLSSASSSSSSTQPLQVRDNDARLHENDDMRSHSAMQSHSSGFHAGAAPNVEDDRDVDDDAAAVDESGNTRVLVGYVGTVEIPRETLLTTRLQSIRNAVRRMQIDHKVHTNVLMVVTSQGVTLFNPMGATVAVYHANKLTHSGLNLEDKRFFGVVTSASEDATVDDDGSLGGACHVFKVDPDQSPHSVHASRARHFGIQCTQVVEETGSRRRCLEFPRSATRIVTCISRLYQQRQAAMFESGMERLSAFSQPIKPQMPGAHRSGKFLCNT